MANRKTETLHALCVQSLSRRQPYPAVLPGQGQPGATFRARQEAQKAASGTSMSELSVASAMARSAARRGSTWCTKNFAAAILPV